MSDKPKVTITMESDGIITLELEPAIAPNTVNNFIDLASKGFYDGLIFHRVIPGFMIQGGCPSSTGTDGPGYGIFGEFEANGFENGLRHTKGVISMARSQNPNSAGSQFFIMHENAPHLDGSYTAFGRVVDGQDVVDLIAACETGPNNRPVEPQVIKTITVDTFGTQYPEPEKI